MYFDNPIAAVGSPLIPNEINPSQITFAIQTPLNRLNADINVLLERVQNSTLPNQSDILQLQLEVQQYTNLLQLTSSLLKDYYDSEKQIITNMSS
jgi:hypothetical protein